MSKEFKPSKSFLKKVKDGKVYPYESYSQRSGAKFLFVGGRVTAEKHRDAGYITISWGGCMRRGKCELTKKGSDFLNQL